MLSSLKSVISTNGRNRILTDHVIFKLRYNEIYQMKTPNVCYCMETWRKKQAYTVFAIAIKHIKKMVYFDFMTFDGSSKELDIK